MPERSRSKRGDKQTRLGSIARGLLALTKREGNVAKCSIRGDLTRWRGTTSRRKEATITDSRLAKFSRLSRSMFVIIVARFIELDEFRSHPLASLSCDCNIPREIWATWLRESDAASKPNYARASRSDACKGWKNLVLAMWRTTVAWCSSTAAATMTMTRKATPSSRRMIPRCCDPACGVCSPSCWTPAGPRDPRARRASAPWNPWQCGWLLWLGWCELDFATNRSLHGFSNR